MRTIKLSPTRSGFVQLVEEVLRMGGTDLHLKAPGRPHVRVADRLIAMSYDRISAQDMRQVMAVLVEISGDEPHLAAVRDARFSMGLDGLGRFRVQAVRQRGSWGVVVHVIATEPPALVDLGVDLASSGILDGGGLVLVGGGRRRQTVLAGLVRAYNENVPGHIVSIEEPMDYLHRDQRAAVTQREVGQDVDTFHSGVLAALRQDPNALALSDVPDTETAEAVLRAAEEGLLVFAGLGALDGNHAVRAFTRRFAGAKEQEVHNRVMDVLRGVVTAPASGTCLFTPTRPAPTETETENWEMVS